uniref:Zinc finger protein RFP-like n=1 Tax=Crocodylus porosus TaxID=8502 RepID=A0A7M4FU86_CROPO
MDSTSIGSPVSGPQLLPATGRGPRLEYLGQMKKRDSVLMKQAGAKRQKIVSDFQQLRRLLQEQEQLLLAQLGELEKEVAKMQKEKDTKLSEEISHLSELISEMEAKCQQPASEFLQDIRRTLSRCEKRVIPQPVPTSSELERRLQDFCQQTCALTETVRKFKDTLLSACEQENEDLLGSYTKAAVTLAPGTAHPRLVLSADRRSVRWRQAWQPLLNNPERFNFMYCVLGHEGFTSGKHCWEVEVGEGDCWAVGAATESVRRKGKFFFSPDEGIWAVQHQFSGPLEALTAPDPTPLSQCQVPRRVRVCLDYAAGQVSFFNADTKAPVFTFPPALFAGERIRPWLWLKPFNVASFGTPALKLCP